MAFKRSAVRSRLSPPIIADVAELADALDSGSSESNFMWVQVPSSAPEQGIRYVLCFFILLYITNSLNYFYISNISGNISHC